MELDGKNVREEPWVSYRDPPLKLRDMVYYQMVL